MIEKIYKELMLMGLVTFCVIMYEATPTGGISETEEDWINAIDFSHVYLFFVTFFFVMHAFYLMFMSVWSSSSYRSMFTEKTVDLMAVLNKVKSNWWDKFLFNVKALPLCSVRNRVEFSMIHSLFVKTYLLPVDFDFPYYLSGCFDRFALKTINRSMFTWIVLLVIVAFNFLRILVGLSCAVPSEEEAEERRRFLQETDESEVEDSGHDHCKEETLYIFLFCGLALIAYTLILTMVSRLYKMRLVDRVYPNHDKIEDYIGLLKNKHDQRKHHDPHAAERMTAEDLKKAIEKEFDEQEEGEEEDEEGIKFLAESLLAGYRWVRECYIDSMVFIRVKFSECCSPSVREERRNNVLGVFGRSRSMDERDKTRSGDAHAQDNRQRSSSVSSAGGNANRVTEDKVHHEPLKHKLTITPASADASVSPRHSAAEERARTEGDPNAGGWLGCMHHREIEEDETAEFKSIFFRRHPLWYFRAVELQIMFTCMYMALWATNFITIVKDTDDLSEGTEALFQFMMLIPILVAFHRIAYIAETYSLIMAISELNLEVIYEVLVNTEDMLRLAEELRVKIRSKIHKWAGTTQPTEEQEREFVHQLFIEVDQDGSGTIDKGEFRQMLRKLNLTYSDHRFTLLFRAVDSIGGDGSLEEEELVDFMFPGSGSQASDLEDPANVGEQAEHSFPTQHLQVKIPGAGGASASERDRRSNSELDQTLAGGTVNPLL
uniref:EF-hand domain-containing protein n=1 Tax=Spumella elongata TaxID=89044 RepID=A0A7S3H5P2_9STRA